jgi:glycerophosphocholine phosphodiesterase GPCPD1
MQFTVHFAVKNPYSGENEYIFVTGSDEKLGLWDPQKALKLEKNDEGIFVGSVNLFDVKQLKFRYFLAYYLESEEGKRSLIIRKWETHLSPRCVLPNIESKNGICRAKVNDVFGFHAGRDMVSDGWLLDGQQNQIHLCVTGEAIKFYKSKTANQEYRIKISPMDLRNRDNSNPYDDGDDDDTPQDETIQPYIYTSYSDTDIAPLTKDQPGFVRQSEYGEVFANGIDYYLYRTYSVAVEYMGFKIEIFKSNGDPPKLLAVGYALPSTLQNTYGKTSVPLLASNGLPVGKIYLGYLFIRPVHNQEFKMDLSFIKHWKKRTTLEVGHRGMGNSYTKCAVARENTLHSLEKAASRGADYVEFDVQLTKDKIPVIFHDFHVMVSVAKRSPEKDVHQIAVKDLKLDQLRLLHLDHVQHHSSTPLNEQVIKVTGDEDEVEELRPFPTLIEALQNISLDVGFNIEIKFPMIQEDGINECENYFEHNEFLDRILKDVFSSGGKRRIVFSSFDPDICMMVAAKQNKYPVLFLCCGANTRHQVYQDARTRTSLTAVNFAAGCGILGVNFHSEDVLRDHSPITKAKELGLISFVWGDELNDKANVEFLKKTVGVDGVIYDRIGETEQRSSVFMLEKAKKTELFAKKPPSPVQTPRAGSAHHLNNPLKFPQGQNFSQSVNQPSHHEWPISTRRRSPTVTTEEKFFAESHGLNGLGYLPQQLRTAQEI